MHGFTRLEVGEIPDVHTGDVVLLIGEVKIIAEETALEFLTEHFLTIGVNSHGGVGAKLSHDDGHIVGGMQFLKFPAQNVDGYVHASRIGVPSIVAVHANDVAHSMPRRRTATHGNEGGKTCRVFSFGQCNQFAQVLDGQTILFCLALFLLAVVVGPAHALVCGFVGHAPEDYAGMILVAIDHLFEGIAALCLTNLDILFAIEEEQSHGWHLVDDQESFAVGDVIDLNGKSITAILPGGSTDKNLSLSKRGTVIDFAGKVIGSVMPDGSIIDTSNIRIGRSLSDGNALNNSGKLIGEIVDGDLVINNEDKIVGYISADGSVIDHRGSITGHSLSTDLAVDNEDEILGRIYKIGTTILGNTGKYVGRLSADGTVVDTNNKIIGYLKSNGSFINLDKRVAGYALQEVAKNRRN